MEIIPTKKTKKMVNGIDHGNESPISGTQTPAIESTDAPKSSITQKALESLAGEEVNGRVIKMIS